MGLGSEIRDPENPYFGSRFKGVKKALDPGSGSATLIFVNIFLIRLMRQSEILYCTFFFVQL
jgi:hypothetical protein